MVDNGSSDNSVPLVRNEFPWTRVIEAGKNTGFSRGNNIGLKESSSRYVATLNNDTTVSPRWLESLYAAAEADPNIGMVASKIYLEKTGNILDSAGMLVYPDGMTRQRGRGEIDAGQFDRSKEILFPSACAALYRREMLDRIGFFDEDFFSYCEDSDLGLRAVVAGWKAVFAPEAAVNHFYSQTSGGYSSFKLYYIERNHLWVLLKNMPFIYLVLFPIYTLWRYATALYGIMSRKGSAAKIAKDSGILRTLGIFLKANFEGVRQLPSIYKKRRVILRSKRISRKEYLLLLKRHGISASELILRD